jgi:hypothetical protein
MGPRARILRPQPRPAWRSDRVSQIARLSHTVQLWPPSSILSAGTLPDGDSGRIRAFVSAVRSGIRTSSNGMLAILKTSHGLKLHEDVFLLPIVSV